jgi:peptide chain release factor 1
MYRLHCTNQKGWKFRTVNVSPGGDGKVGGIRDASAIVAGEGVFAYLRFEAGVHRVQRKPLTDLTKVHTSTITVAVLPAAKNVEVRKK